MMRAGQRLFGALLIFSLFLIPMALQAQQFNPQKPDSQVFDISGPYRRPISMEGDLSYLGLHGFEKGLTRTQWSEVLLTWLAAERAAPTPESTGLGGAPIDSLYIQAQIWTALETQGDPLLINALAASADLRDEEVRKGLRLTLAFAGDVRQIPFLKEALQKDKNSEYRILASGDLAQLGVDEALPLLEQALQDNYFVIIGQASLGNLTPGQRYYPVHESAKDDCRYLEYLISLSQTDPAKRRYLTNQREHFAALLPRATEYNVKNRATIRRMIAMLNP